MAANAYQVGQLIAQLGLDSIQFTAGMTAAQAQMKVADAAMKKATMSMQASITAVGARMQATGKLMTRYMTLPILAIGAASFKAQKDFESSMSKIEGLVGIAADEVQRLSEEVLKLSPSVGRGPEELADALFFIESAGIRGADAMNVLEMAAKASVSGLGETKTIADLVTSAMNAYGKENLNASMATDILTAAVREGKAEATEMAGAIGVVLPIASEMGVTFDQVGAAFAGMTRTGTPARVAATQLKAILSKLMNPTEDAKRALEGMGLSASGLRKQIKEEGLITTLETLRKTTNQYGEDAMGKVFPNIRALMGVLDLMGANMEENIAIADRMSDSTGSLNHAFEAATKTTQFKWDKAIAQVKTTLVKFGTAMKDLVIPIIEKFTEKIKTFTDKLDLMTQAEKESAIKTIALVAALGPLLSITGKLVKAIVANPYTALAIAIAAVVLGTVQWVKANKELFDGMSGIERAGKETIKQYGKQSAAINLLVKKIENENFSNETRIKAINELKKIIPEYNGMITEEGKLINSNTTAIDDYLVALGEKIKLQAYEEEYTRLLKRQFELQGKIADATLNTYRSGTAGKVAEANLIRLNYQYDKNAEAIAEMNTAAKNLNITLGQTPSTVTPETETGTGGTGGSGGDSLVPSITAVEEYVQDASEVMGTYYDLVDEVQKGYEEMMIASEKKVSEAMLKEIIKRMAAEEKAEKERIARAQAYVRIGQDLAYALGEAMAGQEGAFKSMVTTMLSGVNNIISALMAQAVAAYIASKAAIPGGLIAAAAGVPILLALWQNLVPEFATGALVYGETIGKLGEYPGASSNPEVIAPLSDLKKYLQPGGSSGGSPAVIELVLRGRDAYAMVKLEELLQNTY